MAFKLLELFTELTVKDGKLIAAMNGVVQRAKKVASAVERMAAHARRAFLVMAGAISASVLAFSSFERSMAKVKALSGATRIEFARLTAVSRQMGLTTVFTAKQAAEAMASFALQGFKTKQIIEAMPATLNLAAAADLGMAHAATITAGVMRGMRLDTSQLVRVVDNLAFAAANSATTLPDLGEALRALGPVAAATGVRIEEVMASIRGLANVMIRGAVAGTAMRNILIRLQAQPTDVKKELDRLGVVVDDGTGKMKSFAQIVGELNQAMAHYTDIQRNAAASQIAGLRAAAAFNALLDLGADQLREWTREQENSIGATEKMKNIRLDTIFGDWKLFYSAVTELAITMGERLAPAVREILTTGKDLAYVIKDLSGKWQGWITAIITSTAAFSGLIIVLNGVIKLLAVLKIALLSALKSPVLIALAAVAALHVAWNALKKDVAGIEIDSSLPDNLHDTEGSMLRIKVQVAQLQEQLQGLYAEVNDPLNIFGTEDSRLEHAIAKTRKQIDMLIDQYERLQQQEEAILRKFYPGNSGSSEELKEWRKLTGALREMEEIAYRDSLKLSDLRKLTIQEEMDERIREVEYAVERGVATEERAVEVIALIRAAAARKMKTVIDEVAAAEEAAARRREAAVEREQRRKEQWFQRETNYQRIIDRTRMTDLEFQLAEARRWMEEELAILKKLGEAPYQLGDAFKAMKEKIAKDFIKPLRDQIQSLRDSIMGIRKMSLSGFADSLQAAVDSKIHAQIRKLEEQLAQGKRAIKIAQDQDKNLVKIEENTRLGAFTMGA